MMVVYIIYENNCCYYGCHHAGGYRGRGGFRGNWGGGRERGGRGRGDLPPAGIGGINRKQRRAISHALTRGLPNQRQMQRALMAALVRPSSQGAQEQAIEEQPINPDQPVGEHLQEVTMENPEAAMENPEAAMEDPEDVSPN